MEDDLLQFVVEGVGVFLGGEVTLGAPPARDRVRHAIDHVLDAVLALSACRGGPAEVLGHDDVGGQLRPVGRDLHVFLLEDDIAPVPGDRGRPLLPFHTLVGIMAGIAVQPLDGKAAGYGRHFVRRVERRVDRGRVIDGHFGRSSGSGFLRLFHQEFVGFFQIQFKFVFSHTSPLKSPFFRIVTSRRCVICVNKKYLILQNADQVP